LGTICTDKQAKDNPTGDWHTEDCGWGASHEGLVPRND
jgi:hypothetical protein